MEEVFTQLPNSKDAFDDFVNEKRGSVEDDIDEYAGVDDYVGEDDTY